MPVITITSDSPTVEVVQRRQAVDVLRRSFMVEVTGPRAGELPSYSGDYIVVPTLSGSTLPTANKSTRRDIEVKPIPTSKVSNPQGGYTFVIG